MTRKDSLFCGIIEDLDIKTSDTGSLSHQTFAAKDLMDIKGYVTGAGSPDWKKTHNKAEKNCPAVQMLLDEGARLIGKTVTDELAFSLDGLNFNFEIPHNPNMPGRISGGSSSGSASAAANGLCDFALGTDTAGSVRVPSAYCGILGMRPTHGRISSEGVVPLGTTFDTVGWMSRSIETMIQVGSVLLKEKPDDSLPNKLILLENSLNILDPELHAAFLEQWGRLECLGIKQETLKLPSGKLDEYSHLFSVTRGFEAWQAHGQWIEQTKPNLGDSILDRFMVCKNFARAEYEPAIERRKYLIEEIHQILGDAVFVLPTVCGWPPLLSAGEPELTENRKKNILLNSISSFCGLPQLTVPFDIPIQSKKAKFAFSFMGRQNADMELLKLAMDFSITSCKLG